MASYQSGSKKVWKPGEREAWEAKQQAERDGKDTRSALKDAFAEAKNIDRLKPSGTVRDAETKNKPSGTVSNASGTQKKGTWNAEKVMAERRAAAKAQGKGNWNKEEVMRQRREAAQEKKQKREAFERSNEDQYRTASGVWQNPNGKKRWNAEEEMRKRRETAKAQGKGNWNAQDEMRKRREAAMAKKKGK